VACTCTRYVPGHTARFGGWWFRSSIRGAAEDRVLADPVCGYRGLSQLTRGSRSSAVVAFDPQG
jgi:hypothetical protein